MKVFGCALGGILLIDPTCFEDERGFFVETYQEARYKNAGISDHFIQDNHSRSQKNVLRGLHFNKNKPQAQLVTVIRGRIFDVVVDIRTNSPTFGKWYGTELGENGVRQIYMPTGFAHGFCVLSQFADLHYKVTQYYDSSDDGGILWSDKSIGINWPTANPIVSLKDQHNLNFESIQ